MLWRILAFCFYRFWSRYKKMRHCTQYARPRFNLFLEMNRMNRLQAQNNIWGLIFTVTFMFPIHLELHYKICVFDSLRANADAKWNVYSSKPSPLSLCLGFQAKAPMPGHLATWSQPGITGYRAQEPGTISPWPGTWGLSPKARSPKLRP